MAHDRQYQTAIVGGGLAGLTAAVILGRAGVRTIVLERASHLGGRADSQETKGFTLNVGPHAIYRAGLAIKTLESLVGPITGGIPRSSGTTGLRDGRLGRLPGTAGALLTTTLLGVRGKLDLVRFLTAIKKVRVETLDALTIGEFLDRSLSVPDARLLAEALVRVSTYTNAPREMSAQAAVEQLRIALRAGVLYVHGGWKTIVERLRAAAVPAGVDVVTDARTIAVEGDGRVTGVATADGREIAASSAILAVSPSEAAALLPDERGARLRDVTRSATPVRVSTLDIGLARMPRKDPWFVLGIDRPLYLSVHSDAAALAPSGGGTIHAMKYLGDEAPQGAEKELEDLLDLAQPGWRDELVIKRPLSSMTVTHVLPKPGGGLAGRPAVSVPEMDGLFLAGDWVGPAGWLADAAIVSAACAARNVLAGLSERAAA